MLVESLLGQVGLSSGLVGSLSGSSVVVQWGLYRVKWDYFRSNGVVQWVCEVSLGSSGVV